MRTRTWRSLGLAAIAGVAMLFQSMLFQSLLFQLLAWQQDPAAAVYPLPEKAGPLRKALSLLRESKTAEARRELEEQRKQRPADAEVLYQIARSYLLDFYRQQAPGQRRISLGLAMETLNAVLSAPSESGPVFRASRLA
jgi:hypothetical protein